MITNVRSPIIHFKFGDVIIMQYIGIPVQLDRSSVSLKPSLQEQWTEPGVFTQRCSQLTVLSLHSSVSAKSRNRTTVKHVLNSH